MQGTIRDVILFAGHTGARKGEILNLPWENVSFERAVIILDKTKGNNVVEVPMTTELRQMLLERKKSSINEYVFNSRLGKKYAVGGTDTAFDTVCKHAGIKGFKFHGLRHFFGSQNAMGGIDLGTVQKFMGHRDIKTTMIYLDISNVHKRQAMSRYEDILNGKLVNMFNSNVFNSSKSVHNDNEKSATK